MTTEIMDSEKAKSLIYSAQAGEPFTAQIAQPNYTIKFHKGKTEIGLLDFNGDTMKFEGVLDESAKVFFDFIAQSFAGRLADERKAERDRCAKLCRELGQNKTSGAYRQCAVAIERLKD